MSNGNGIEVVAFKTDDYAESVVDSACTYAINTVRYGIQAEDSNGKPIDNMPATVTAKLLTRHLAIAFGMAYEPQDCAEVAIQAIHSLINHMKEVCPDGRIDEFAQALTPLSYTLVRTLCEASAFEGGEAGKQSCLLGIARAVSTQISDFE